MTPATGAGVDARAASSDSRGTAGSRRFLIYLTGRTVSLVGDGVWFIALAWAAVRAGGPASTSLVLAAGTLPRAGLMLLGGVVADRLGARRVMVLSDAGRAVLLVAGAGVAAVADPGIPFLVVLSAVFGLVDALYHPAAGMVPRALLHDEELPRGQALAQMASRTADVMGAPLGGGLVAAGGLALACAADALTFLAVLGAVLAVRLPGQRPRARGTRPRLGRELRDGLRYVAGQPDVRALLVLVAALNAFGGPVTNVGVLLRVEQEGWGVGGLATFEAVFAAGAVLGAAGVARRGPVRSPAVVGTWWAVVQALGIAAVGLAPTRWSMWAAGALIGFTAGPASAYLLGQIQFRVAEHYLGRVMSLVGLSAVGLVPVSFAVFGALAEVVPVGWLAVGCCTLMLPPCAVALRFFTSASHDREGSELLS